jgi:hypothetical protein
VLIVYSQEVKKEHPAVPDEDQTFVPPKSWTAWPLPPNEVPREGEHIGPADPNEKYTFSRKEVQRPSRELEDAMLGLTLKFAKERFLTRTEEKNEDPQSVNQRDDDAEDHGDDQLSDSHDSQSRDVSIKEASAPPPAEEPLKPVISTDDGRSRVLLRPSIRHTLAKLDEVLMALHHARKSCRRYQDLATTSDFSGEDAESEPVTPQKRPRGRPRNFSDLPDRSRPQSTPSPGGIDDADLLRSKKTHLGRPLKLYDRLEGETQQDYLIRIAKIQKKALPAFAPPREIKSEPSPSPSSQTSRRSSRTRATSEEREIRRRKRLRPRDWSEVLSSAALVGFPPDVIARATQRCANIFGEGMEMRAIIETPFMEKVAGITTRYVPEEIPDFDEEILVSSSDEGDVSNDSSSEEHITNKRPDSRAKSHVHPSQQTCFCPMPTCPRRIQGFKDKDSLRRHIEFAHEISKEEVDDYILPSDEEMSGAVHVDGFLRPLKKSAGARGSYKKTAKRARVESSGDEGEDGAGSSRRHSRSPALTTVKEQTAYESSDGDPNDQDDASSTKGS